MEIEIAEKKQKVELERKDFYIILDQIKLSLAIEKPNIEKDVIKLHETQIQEQLAKIELSNQQIVEKKAKEFKIIEKGLLKSKSKEEIRLIVAEHQSAIEALTKQLKDQAIKQKEDIKTRLNSEFSIEVNRRLKIRELELIDNKTEINLAEKKRRDQEQLDIAYRSEQDELMAAEKKKSDLERVFTAHIFTILILDYCQRKKSEGVRN